MSNITSPTLLVDKQKTMANIRRMNAKAEACNLVFKPHFKTHQSVEIGNWFRNEGVDKITVSSVKMAQYFAHNGWTDITIAFPCNVLQADEMNTLAGSIKLSILISDIQTANILKDTFTNEIQVYIEIDTGSDRTGFKTDDTAAIKKVLKPISKSSSLRFKGFYSHPGHSYAAQSREQIKAVHHDAVQKMRQLNDYFKTDFPDLLCCMGDTPCSSAGEDWHGIDEMSPGNFVFYDVMQTHIGSCGWDDIAVALACPVVSKYPQRQEIVVHGGAVHLSKESITQDSVHHLGKVVRFNDDGRWGNPEENSYVKSISQEHGIIRCSASFYKNVQVGDVIGILPVHSCLTADVMQGYCTTGKLEPIDHLKGSFNNF